MEEEYIILGAGGHAKVIAEAILQNGDLVVGFLDDNEEEMDNYKTHIFLFYNR